MLKELLDGILKLAADANRTEVLRVPGDPPHVYRLTTKGIVTDPNETEPMPRKYELFTIDDVVAAIKRMAAQSVDKATGDIDAGAKVLVFCGRGGITVILDEPGKRREWLNMQLPQSHEFTKLENLERCRTPMKQRDFINCLRIDLCGAVEPEIVNRFRSIGFTSQAAAKATVNAGKESLGKDVLHEVLCDGAAPPEEIAVNLCVYRDLAEMNHRRAIRCAVDTNMQEQNFTLIPLGGELERARRETDAMIQADLQTKLKDTGVAVLCGKS